MKKVQLSVQPQEIKPNQYNHYRVQPSIVSRRYSLVQYLGRIAQYSLQEVQPSIVLRKDSLVQSLGSKALYSFQKVQLSVVSKQYSLEWSLGSTAQQIIQEVQTVESPGSIASGVTRKYSQLNHQEVQPGMVSKNQIALNFSKQCKRCLKSTENCVLYCQTKVVEFGCTRRGHL